MAANVPAETINGASPTSRRALVLEQTRAGDGVLSLWVAQSDGDGETVLLAPSQLRDLIASLTERLAVLEGRTP